MVSDKINSSILLALTDMPTLTVISYHLERQGFIVNSVQSTEMIIDMIERIEPNIIILDEKISGTLKPLDLCSIIKNNPRTKDIKIIYAAKEELQDSKLIDANITKPFVPSSLVSKVKSFTEEPSVYNGKNIIQYHDIEMNMSTFRVIRNGRTIHLGPNELKILQCFLEMPGRILSREHIMNYVWGHNSDVELRTIDVHINRLRSALKDNDDELPLIKTIRSSGYSISAPRVLAKA